MLTRGDVLASLALAPGYNISRLWRCLQELALFAGIGAVCRNWRCSPLALFAGIGAVRMSL
jgi:hypothetical protein